MHYRGCGNCGNIKQRVVGFQMDGFPFPKNRGRMCGFGDFLKDRMIQRP